MGEDLGCREAKQVGREVSPYIAIKLVARGGCSSTRGSFDCGLLTCYVDIDSFREFGPSSTETTRRRNSLRNFQINISTAKKKIQCKILQQACN